MRNMTWQEKKEWLETAFNTSVTTIWNGPKDFQTITDDVEIVQGRARGSLFGRGITGEKSICALFERVTRHGSDEHIIYGPDKTRVTVNPETLTLHPLVRR